MPMCIEGFCPAGPAESLTVAVQSARTERAGADLKKSTILLLIHAVDRPKVKRRRVLAATAQESHTLRSVLNQLYSTRVSRTLATTATTTSELTGKSLNIHFPTQCHHVRARVGYDSPRR